MLGMDEVMYRNCRGTVSFQSSKTKITKQSAKLDCRVTLQNASLNRILFDEPRKRPGTAKRSNYVQLIGPGRDISAGKALDQDAVIGRYGEGFSVLSGAEI